MAWSDVFLPGTASRLERERERQSFVLLRLINMSLCHWMDRTEEMDLSPGSRSVMIESVGILTDNK